MTADELEREIEALTRVVTTVTRQIKTHGDSTGVLTTNLRAASKQLAKLQKAEEVAAGFEALSKSTRGFNGNILDAANEIKKLSDLEAASGVTISDETRQRKAAIIQNIKQTAVMQTGVGAIATVTAEYVKNTIANIKDFVTALSSGTNAFDLAASIQKNNIDMYRNLAKAGASAGETLGLLGMALSTTPFGRVLSAATYLLSKFTGTVADATAEIAKFGVDIVLAELQKTIAAFAQVTKAGFVAAGGMGELKVMATAAGVPIKEMAQMVAENNKELIAFGGTVAGGTAKLTKVFGALTTVANKTLVPQLMNLGYSIGDIVAGTADYMAMQAKAGNLNRLRNLSEEQLAKQSYDYMVNLKAISAITGEEVKAATKRARDASTQGAVSAKLQKMGAESMAKFEAGISGLSPELQKAIQQQFVYGTIMDKDLAAAIAQMPAAQQLINDVVSGISDSNKGLTEYTDSMMKSKEQLSPMILAQANTAAESISGATLAIGAFAGMTQIIQAMQQTSLAVTQSVAGTVAATTQTAKSAAETQDNLTKSVSAATAAFTDMRVALEKQLTPAITNFSIFSNKIISETQKTVDDILEKAGIPNPNRVVTTPVLPPAETTPAVQVPIEQGLKAGEGIGVFLGKAVGKLINAITGSSSGSSSAQSNNNLPQYAEGGIAKSPSIAGEAGPEAVIPLKGGGIPMNIDFSPMLREMQSQNALTRELLDEMRDTRNIQQRILNAAY